MRSRVLVLVLVSLCAAKRAVPHPVLQHGKHHKLAQSPVSSAFDVRIELGSTQSSHNTLNLEEEHGECDPSVILAHVPTLAFEGQTFGAIQNLQAINPEPEKEIDFEQFGIGDEQVDLVNSRITAERTKENLEKLFNRVDLASKEIRAMHEFLKSYAAKNPKLTKYECVTGGGAEEGGTTLIFPLPTDAEKPFTAVMFDESRLLMRDIARAIDRLDDLETLSLEEEHHVKNTGSHHNHVALYRKHSVRQFEEALMLEDVRAVTRVTSSWITVGGILSTIGCVAAIALTAGAATPCLIISISFSATQMLNDLTLATTWKQALKTVAHAGVDVALAFLPHTDTSMFIHATSFLVSGLMYVTKGKLPGHGIDAYDRLKVEVSRSAPQAVACPEEIAWTSEDDVLQWKCYSTTATDRIAALPKEKKYCAIVMNPHPSALFGGPTYEYEGVVTVAEGLRQAGFMTFVFNYYTNLFNAFRTTAGDARIVTKFLAAIKRSTTDCEKFALAGFSYGAAVAAEVLKLSANAEFGILISPPVSIPVTGNHYGTYFEHAAESGKLVSFIRGSADVMCDATVFEKVVSGFQRASVHDIRVIVGADHVYNDALPELQDEVAELATVMMEIQEDAE